MLCQFLLYNKVNQLYIYIYPHILSLLCIPPPRPSHPSRWSQSTELISLCYVAASHQLFYFSQSIYVNATLPLRPNLPFPLPVSSKPFSMSASLFLSCHQVHQNHFYFLDSIYVCQHMVFVFLFLFFFLTSLLEYNCFTMVCQFLLYNKVNQLYIYICPHISSLLHLPPSHPPHPTPLGGHKALS